MATSTSTTPSALYFFIDCHVRETRMHFYKRFREPRLFRDARRLDYEKIVRRCKRRPRAASQEAKFQHDYVNQQCALHYILEPLYFHGVQWDAEMQERLMRARHEAAVALLKVFPGCARLTCAFGTTPLMMVCIDSPPCMADVEALLEACPKCASMVDMEKRTALHYACVNNRNNFEMIQAIVRAFPEATSFVDKNGRTPLHYACMAGPSVNSKATDPHPQPANYVGFKTVLLQQSRAKTCNLQVVSLLLEAYPEAAMMTDEDGRTPLHHLCLHRYGRGAKDEDSPRRDEIMDWVDVLDLVARKSPEAASQSDGSGLAPYQMLSGMGWSRTTTGDDNGMDKSRHVVQDLLDFLKQDQTAGIVA